MKKLKIKILKMNKSVLILWFLIVLSFQIQAQNKDGDKIEQLKIAYFTEKLNLTANEAVKFWPVYNKHTKLYEKLRDEKWDSIKSRLNSIESLSHQEAEILLKDYLSYKQARVDNREAFVSELKTVISPKQIMTLKKAEYDFHKKLLKQYQSDKSSNE